MQKGGNGWGHNVKSGCRKNEVVVIVVMMVMMKEGDGEGVDV